MGCGVSLVAVQSLQGQGYEMVNDSQIAGQYYVHTVRYCGTVELGWCEVASSIAMCSLSVRFEICRQGMAHHYESPSRNDAMVVPALLVNYLKLRST